ncbi:hypothetical protein F0562_030690 [Nyssa sinensis]|uniref:Uncharacterized protein n=1 Tax=Nyssa sinensis TaxID=561372 RepID=A0A5J5B1M0_9ASTE|nr:hypothetical protein F0562_030690 [Nyssa sinensis]
MLFMDRVVMEWVRGRDWAEGSQEAGRGTVGRAGAFGTEIPEEEGIGTVPGDDAKEVSMAGVTGGGCGTNGDAALRGGALAEDDESTGFAEGPFCVSSNRTCREWYSLLVVGSKHLYAFRAEE